MSTSNWTILTNRLGVDLRDPTQSSVEAAIQDLHEHHGDAEHASLTLRQGSDDGPLRVLELFSNGTMIYAHYSDSDFETLISEKRAELLGVFDLTRRLEYLRSGDVPSLDSCQWT